MFLQSSQLYFLPYRSPSVRAQFSSKPYLDRSTFFLMGSIRACPFSGFCCGIAALLLTSRLDSAVPTNAEGYEMNAIAAVVIGGTSMSGGEGSLIGTVIGTMLIGVIANGMNLLLIPTGPQRMVTGSIIVIAVIVDVLRKKANSKSK